MVRIKFFCVSSTLIFTEYRDNGHTLLQTAIFDLATSWRDDINL